MSCVFIQSKPDVCLLENLKGKDSMGKYTIIKTKYHTEKGFFTDNYISLPGSVAYRVLIAPLIGFDGPFFYVKETGKGEYEITGEWYQYQKNWKESMDGYRNQVADIKKELNDKGCLGYFFVDDNGCVIKKEWAEYHLGRVENGNVWFITDDDSFQCCRTIKPNNAYRPASDKGPPFDGVYEFVQINRYGPTGTKSADKFAISHGTIDMKNYTQTQIVGYIQLFGYKCLVDFISSQKEFSCRLVAEMIFETDWTEFIQPDSYPAFIDACKEVNKITGLEIRK